MTIEQTDILESIIIRLEQLSGIAALLHDIYAKSSDASKKEKAISCGANEFSALTFLIHNMDTADRDVA